MLPELPFRWFKAGLFVLASVLLIAAGCGEVGSSQPATQIFVSLPAQDSLVRIDGQTGEVLGRTLVGRLPHHLVSDPERGRLYVTLTGSQAVAELDLQSGELLRTFLTDAVPETRADGRRIDGHFQRDAFSRTSCFDCHKGGPDGVKPVIIGARPFGMLLAPDRQSLIVANTRSDALARIELKSGTITQQLSLPKSGSAVEPTSLAQLGEQIFATVLAVQPSDEPAVLHAIDGRTNSALHQTPIGPRANFVLADPGRQRTYVANFETNTVSIYGANGQEQGKLTVGPGPQGMQLTPDGSHLLVANYYGNSLSSVRLSDNQVETFPLSLDKQHFSNPSHLVISEDGQSAFVVTSGTQGFLVWVDLVAKKATRATPVGPLPFDLAVTTLDRS